MKAVGFHESPAANNKTRSDPSRAFKNERIWKFYRNTECEFRSDNRIQIIRKVQGSTKAGIVTKHLIGEERCANREWSTAWFQTLYLQGASPWHHADRNSQQSPERKTWVRALLCSLRFSAFSFSFRFLFLVPFLFLSSPLFNFFSF